MKHSITEQLLAPTTRSFTIEDLIGRRKNTFSEKLILEIRALEEAINLQATVYDTISRYEDAVASGMPYEHDRSFKAREHSKQANDGLQGLLKKLIEIREARFVINHAPPPLN